MKKIALFCLLLPTLGYARSPAPLVHCVLCTTAAINVAYHIGLHRNWHLLSGQIRQLQSHLLLQSGEPEAQRKNLIYQLQETQSELDSLELRRTLSIVGLALHTFYAGYYLRNRLLQSPLPPE